MERSPGIACFDVLRRKEGEEWWEEGRECRRRKKSESELQLPRRRHAGTSDANPCFPQRQGPVPYMQWLQVPRERVASTLGIN